MKQLTVVKIGGNIIDRAEELNSFLKEFSSIEGPRVLIHGGGVMATELSPLLGIKPQVLNGRRITDLETLKLVTMLYAGWINKNIVAQLQGLGCNSIGLSGADGDSVPATKRSPIPIDYGYVGDVNPIEINIGFLLSLLGKGITPVFCPITHDRSGSLLNTNADTMASSLAIALSTDYYVKLIYCFEKEGVLSNPQDESSIIPLLTNNSYERLKNEKVIREGMIPKMDNAFYAKDSGVHEVQIKHASNLNNVKGTYLK